MKTLALLILVNFISRVWLDAPSEYGGMTEADALAICREIFLGGRDTTVHGIANSLYLLFTQPDARADVERDRQAALSIFVEEASGCTAQCNPITDHLAFNVGPRACVGSNLARVEMRESINVVLDRLPNVRPGR